MITVALAKGRLLKSFIEYLENHDNAALAS